MIRIFADTMCDIPKEYVERYNIRTMPLTVNFGDKSYRDTVDITMVEFYKYLEASEALPTTSQVPPIEFYNAYKEELEKGNEIISISGSSALSGTHNSAVLAKNQLETDKIHIIDSQGVSLGAGMLAIKAARLVEEGKSCEEIVAELEKAKEATKYMFIVDTLKYLQKGGRISLSASVLGSILNIKPILTMKEGKLELIDKTRGIKKGISVVMDMIRDNGWDLNGKTIGLNHTASPENAELMLDAIKAEYNVKEIIRGEVGSIVATHAGPGAVALYFEA